MIRRNYSQPAVERPLGAYVASRSSDAGIARYRAFVTECARIGLVVGPACTIFASLASHCVPDDASAIRYLAKIGVRVPA